MSDKHETAIRHLTEEVWNKGRVETLDTYLTTDVRRQDPMDSSVGIEGYRNVVKKYRTAFPDCRLEIDEILSTGDRAVLRWTATGTHRGPLDGLAPTGRRTKINGISVMRFSGDRLSEEFGQWDALGLMQQLGAVTLPGRTAGAGG